MAGTAPPLVKSAARTLDIIEYIAKSPKSPNFTAILMKMDIPKSSLSLLLQELVNSEYIDYDPDTRVYLPGLKLIQISAICINNTNISREITLGIRHLSNEFDETTHAAVLDGRYIVYIAKHHGSRDVSVVASIGYRIPAHATAIGKVLLSTLPVSEIRSRMAGIQLERYTDNTITDLEQLLGELEKVARQGFAIDDQEIIPGGICVAAPIVEKTKKTVAAISVTMAANKAHSDLMPILIDKVCTMAERVSMRLGNL